MVRQFTLYLGSLLSLDGMATLPTITLERRWNMATRPHSEKRITTSILSEYRDLDLTAGRGHWRRGRIACPMYVKVAIKLNWKPGQLPPVDTISDMSAMAKVADKIYGFEYRSGFECTYNSSDPMLVYRFAPSRGSRVSLNQHPRWSAGYLDGVALRRHIFGR
jgi:hypothetical protein